jgi:predicted ArsR family transcriptional regulator
MAMRTAPVSSVVPSTATEILTVIAAEEPPGATADQVARALGLGLDGDTVQGELEELVARGLLDWRGLGRGALYTRHTTPWT